MSAYETVIGLEVHAQLATRSKLFCRCETSYGQPPNRNVCEVCLGLPGALPSLNREALRMAVTAGLALGCTIHRQSRFARKQYFYPDLPKGYQISQLDEPYCTGGGLKIEVGDQSQTVRLTRIHMEEDAGKSQHGVGGDSLVDLNRAGVPLIEIVSEPDLRTSEAAVQYLKDLRDILMFLGVNDGNMEEGSFRCDANVSIRPTGSATLGTRTELKNLNSFRYIQRAIDVEVARQIAVVSAGGQVVQETRSFDPDSGRTRSLRSKEDSHDYRYFPDPDLPPVTIDDALLAEADGRATELPTAVRHRWQSELGLSEYASQALSAHPAYVSFFEQVLQHYPHAQKAANWVLTEVLRGASAHGLSATWTVSPLQVAELLELVEQGKISGKQAKEVHAAMEGSEHTPAEIVASRGLELVSDTGQLEKIIDKVLDRSAAQVAQYRGGKTGILGYFVGQVMKESQGQADPKSVSELLKQKLEGP